MSLVGSSATDAFPLQESPVEPMELLDEGNLEFQTRRDNGISNRLTELGDDHLLPLVDDKGSVGEHYDK